MSSAIQTCRSCGGQDLEPILALGETVLADALLKPSQLGQPEPAFPLDVAFCRDCSLVQILETVPPDILFGRDYQYYSSFSDALLQHSRANALELAATRRLGSASLVVELASNDGYLLKNFVDNGVPVLGIDPAEDQAGAARRRGVPTLCAFFTRELAEKLRSEGHAADVIIGNNVLAHVPDTNGFVSGNPGLAEGRGHSGDRSAIRQGFGGSYRV